MLKRFAVAALLAALYAASPSQAAGTKPVDCDITVDGKTYVKGRCDYRAEEGGSFQVSSQGYFVQVTVTGKDVGEAHWNETPASTHAQAPLGTVTRMGACWSNAKAKICAHALSEAETKKALAVQPDGKMLWPDFASTACIGVEGKIEEGATPVLDNCNIPADLIFEAADEGLLSINKHPHLCLDLESPGMSKPAQLVLAACRSESRAWYWRGTSGQSAVVSSSDGLCLIIPKDVMERNDNFPWTIQAKPCAQAGDEAMKLNLSKD